jgi:DUF1365 family protein
LEGALTEIQVQTFPRVWGYLFNPVSFWYCRNAEGETQAIVAEVNNTFGQRHCYCLTPDPSSGSFQAVSAEKIFYVSPFYPVEGSYRFSFNLDQDRPRAHIDYYRHDQLELNTAISGQANPFCQRQLLSALIRQPFLTLGVMAKIHWQALRLWIKGVPLCSRPQSVEEKTP